MVSPIIEWKFWLCEIMQTNRDRVKFHSALQTKNFLVERQADTIVMNLTVRQDQMINSLRKFFDNASRVSATLGDAAVATLYPGACRVCGAMIESWRDGVACSACWHEVEHEAGDFCAKCWTPLAHAPRAEAGARACGQIGRASCRGRGGIWEGGG